MKQPVESKQPDLPGQTHYVGDGCPGGHYGPMDLGWVKHSSAVSVPDPNISLHAAPEFQIGARRKTDSADIGLGYVIAPGIGQAADAITTVVALRRGYVEGNPVMAHVTGNPGLFVGLKLAAGLGFGFVTKALAKRSPRAARAFSVVTSFLGFVPAALNVKAMGR